MATRTATERTPLTVKTLSRALTVIEAFEGGDGELGITELSKRLRLHKNNVFRILSTLQGHGYVEQNQCTGDYRLGRQVFVLGQLYIHRMGLLRQARPVMERITETSNEMCALAIMRGWRALFLDAVGSWRTVRIASPVGHLVPLYATGFGKAMLGPVTAAEMKLLLSQPPAGAHHRLPPTPELFEAEIERTRAAGYAVGEGEFDEGVTELAAPVFDYSRRIVGAIGIIGPTPRFSHEIIETRLLPLLREGAAEISRRLGYG